MVVQTSIVFLVAGVEKTYYVWQFLDEIMSASLDSGFYELFVRDVFPSVSNVIGDRHSEKNRFLRHDADLFPEPVDVQFGQFDGIQINLKKK